MGINLKQVHQRRTDACHRMTSRDPNSGGKCRLAGPITVPNSIALRQTTYEKIYRNYFTKVNDMSLHSMRRQ